MLVGQLQRSIFLQHNTLNLLRDVKRLLLQLSPSSFSPKLTKLSHMDTFKCFKFTRTIVAIASDSHKYLISLHPSMTNVSTAPRYFITPLHASSFSLEIYLITNFLTPEAISTSLLSTPLSHVYNSRTFNEGSASNETSTKLRQRCIFRTFNEGRAL
ncbi:hypothetical protein Hanom_Chr04g00300241 [Helianthus anomalus]